MASKLQPIVAICQQPIRATARVTLQPVVALTKQEVRAAFSRRLNRVLDETPSVPKTRGRRTWVAKRYGVSIETARKWLTGVDVPDEGNGARIATDLQISLDWLRAGIGSPRAAAETDRILDELVAVWASLGEGDRKEVVKFAKFRRDNNDPSPPDGTKTVHPRPRHPI